MPEIVVSPGVTLRRTGASSLGKEEHHVVTHLAAERTGSARHVVGLGINTAMLETGVPL
jgi:hypothetical protein